jgi:hypothetical protein
MWFNATGKGEFMMEVEVMKKKLDAYRRSNGQFNRVNGDLLIEFLRMWEAHTGPAVELASKLGMKSKQMGRLVCEARKVATATENLDPAFHELQVQAPSDALPSGVGIEIAWGSDKIIRFPTVDALVDFLKKAA